jgi:hypothetical protein
MSCSFITLCGKLCCCNTQYDCSHSQYRVDDTGRYAWLSCRETRARRTRWAKERQIAKDARAAHLASLRDGNLDSHTASNGKPSNLNLQGLSNLHSGSIRSAGVLGSTLSSIRDHYIEGGRGSPRGSERGYDVSERTTIDDAVQSETGVSGKDDRQPTSGTQTPTRVSPWGVIIPDVRPDSPRIMTDKTGSPSTRAMAVSDSASPRPARQANTPPPDTDASSSLVEPETQTNGDATRRLMSPRDEERVKLSKRLLDHALSLPELPFDGSGPAEDKLKSGSRGGSPQAKPTPVYTSVPRTLDSTRASGNPSGGTRAAKSGLTAAAGPMQTNGNGTGDALAQCPTQPYNNFSDWGIGQTSSPYGFDYGVAQRGKKGMNKLMISAEATLVGKPRPLDMAIAAVRSEMGLGGGMDEDEDFGYRDKDSGKELEQGGTSGEAGGREPETLADVEGVDNPAETGLAEETDLTTLGMEEAVEEEIGRRDAEVEDGGEVCEMEDVEGLQAALKGLQDGSADMGTDKGVEEPIVLVDRSDDVQAEQVGSNGLASPERDAPGPGGKPEVEGIDIEGAEDKDRVVVGGAMGEVGQSTERGEDGMVGSEELILDEDKTGMEEESNMEVQTGMEDKTEMEVDMDMEMEMDMDRDIDMSMVPEGEVDGW